MSRGSDSRHFVPKPNTDELSAVVTAEAPGSPSEAVIAGVGLVL